MKYYIQSNVHIIECCPAEIRVKIVDIAKRAPNYSTYINGGFFGVFKEGKQSFTLPVAHIKGDYEIQDTLTHHYCQERGVIDKGKFTFDSSKWRFGNEQFYQKSVSTLIINGGSASIVDCASVNPNCEYAISGVPVMKNGNDVKWYQYVAQMGWQAGNVRPTKHSFIGLKNDNKIYLMTYKSKTDNLIYSAECFKLFKSLGFKNVLKLDGGGSEIMRYQGKTVDQIMTENRRINNIIVVEPNSQIGNPYPVPTRTLKSWVTGDDVKWLQYELMVRGYDILVDGSFGNGTRSAVMKYQKDKGLAVDGSVGNITRNSLLFN